MLLSFLSFYELDGTEECRFVRCAEVGWLGILWARLGTSVRMG
jgi:hypothetical protein